VKSATWGERYSAKRHPQSRSRRRGASLQALHRVQGADQLRRRGAPAPLPAPGAQSALRGSRWSVGARRFPTGRRCAYAWTGHLPNSIVPDSGSCGVQGVALRTAGERPW